MTSVEMPKRSAVKSRVPVAFKSVRSLPLDFRFTTGSPTAAEGGEKQETGNLGALEEEEEVGGVEGNDESPYGSKTTSREERPLEEEEGESAMSRLQAVSPLRIESRWSDTSSYGAKKVHTTSNT